MEEELKTKLLEWLDKLDSAAETGGQFVIEQAPLVVQEYLAWVFWSNVFFASMLGVASLFCVVVGFYGMRIGGEWFDSAEEEKKGPFAGFCLASLLICVGGGIAFGGSATGYIYDAIKVSVAPRVVLIEKAAELAR